MINKKNLIRIFIIFFIINMLYYTIYKTYAATLTVTKSEVSVNESGGTGITVILNDTSLYNPNAKNGGLEVGVFDAGTNEPKGDVKVSIGKADVKSGVVRWDVGIKGTTKGKVKLMFSVKNLFSPSVTVTINDKNSTSNSTNSSNTVTINTDVLREDLANEFDPNNPIGGWNVSQPVINVIIPVVSRVLSILQIIGAIVLVLSLALAGFNGVLGAGDGFSEDLNLNVSTSVNEYGNKVEGVQNLTPGALSKIIRRALIGSIILESSLTIVRIVFNICTSL